ncbi:N-acetyl-beta-glucosaminyl-glycoprotein 4-beta-N-acetylgalactosaminyltransferase 1 [Bagarius yarrelli]|uniref:Hexosyltransferase n=1 Tax=Bagarius yarrelli TaxID=175774 RepID=A0A556TRL8_BAGYA|nr:N-acetyl-beta-glucosaminyl-glycoprotein 4-beta-N-acetylgalactosaminyltransferase 1 [Bagarius yarrelli]
MLRFPVKKIRKQFKLLLLLVLLTFAVWFTYLHINQSKSIRLHFNYGKDGERQAEGTDASHKKNSRSSDSHHKSEDFSDSHEEDPSEDELHAAADRDQSELLNFLAKKHTKLPWKPEWAASIGYLQLLSKVRTAKELVTVSLKSAAPGQIIDKFILPFPSHSQQSDVAVTLSHSKSSANQKDLSNAGHPVAGRQHKGQANLHVFEDWCGSSTAQLRKNLHFPLYPHTRTVIKKLAVAPKWKNYGLRIFGFVHPYKDGDFQFAVASDDNAEFWLSSDESPLNARLLVYVGQHLSKKSSRAESKKAALRRSVSTTSSEMESCLEGSLRQMYEYFTGVLELLMKLQYVYSKTIGKPVVTHQISVRVEYAVTATEVFLVPLCLYSLIASRRYYFEILHKQDDKGSDHVEVGWRPFLPGLKYEVIDSAYISMYTDESGLKMNSVDHIPQTLASHSRLPIETKTSRQHGADMLKPDPRDTFFRTPMIDPSRLENVLPPCLYSPTYVVKDFPIARYQGLQFVYLSFVYPNDFTRLTHMERENKCFYRESPIYLEKFGFYKYMKMDEEEDDRPFFFPNPDDFLEEEEGVDPEDEEEIVGTPPSKQVMYPSQASHTSSPSQKSGSVSTRKEEELHLKKTALREQRHYFQKDETLNRDWKKRAGPEDPDRQPEMAETEDAQNKNVVRGRSLSWIQKHKEGVKRKEHTPKLSQSSLLFPQKSSLTALTNRAKQLLTNSAHAGQKDNTHRNNVKTHTNANKERKKDNKIYITRPRPGNEKKNASQQPREVFPGVFLYHSGKTTKLMNLNSKPKVRKSILGASQFLARPSLRENRVFPLSSNSSHQSVVHPESSRVILTSHAENGKLAASPASPSLLHASSVTPLSVHSISVKNVLPTEPPRFTSYLRTTEITETQVNRAEIETEQEEEGALSDYSYEEIEPRPGWAEEAINWQRTFSINSMDFETLRSDWNDLRCNVSGNLQLPESEVVDVLAQYMEKLNERNGGIYTLLRIINVEKRRDSARGNRYLVELELMERGRNVVRLSEYIYLLLHRGRIEDSLEASDGPPPLSRSAAARATLRPGTVYAKPLLCQPVMLQWKKDVMVHFVVPVKNQARWVQQFISDMELLHHETKDENFNIIIVDFQSDDMDIEQALRDSSVPRYDYLRREGNFERSAGLQIGVDTIEDSHSIVFLCDLHIHFPLNILESIRKHCVEGKLAFAPIVMRLGCGSSPQEPDGYWEVNGFGLFGIYKSDFDKIGGMNTEEFKDRWGGEDWELLDRVLQNGLEVERLRLRNFFHYYHSKRGMWNSQIKRSPKG